MRSPAVFAKFYSLGIAFLALVGVLFILGIGWFIAPHDKLKASDAIIVVSGGDNNKRTDEGVRLWRGGWGHYLVFSGAAADRGTSNAAVMSMRAVSEGVPMERILIEEKSRNTLENAEFLKPLLDAHNIKTAILVSSPYHTRRVKTTFQKVFGDNYTFRSHPAKDSLWARSSWWRDPDTIDLTFTELKKTFYVKFLQSTPHGQNVIQ